MSDRTLMFVLIAIGLIFIFFAYIGFKKLNSYPVADPTIMTSCVDNKEQETGKPPMKIECSIQPIVSEKKGEVARR